MRLEIYFRLSSGQKLYLKVIYLHRQTEYIFINGISAPDIMDTRKRKEGNVLFNDALNTFYLRLYGVRHMVKDHSDSKRGNHLRTLLPQKEGNVLFNDTLNTFYLQLYGVERILEKAQWPIDTNRPYITQVSIVSPDRAALTLKVIYLQIGLSGILNQACMPFCHDGPRPNTPPSPPLT